MTYSEEWKKDVIRITLLAAQNGAQDRARRILSNFMKGIGNRLSDAEYREMRKELERTMKDQGTPR